MTNRRRAPVPERPQVLLYCTDQGGHGRAKVALFELDSEGQAILVPGDTVTTQATLRRAYAANAGRVSDYDLYCGRCESQRGASGRHLQATQERMTAIVADRLQDRGEIRRVSLDISAPEFAILF